jgi:RND family efflux transporter MFP subunit
MTRKKDLIYGDRIMNQPNSPLDGLRIQRKPAPESKPFLWRFIVAALILLFSAALAWWYFLPGTVEVQTAEAREAASSAAGQTVLNASGYVTARREATVSSKVTGKVDEVLIEEGMKVKAGQVLARLDDTNVKASLDVAEAQWDSAKASLEETRAEIKQADQEFQRISELARQKIASQSDYDVAESNARSLEARLTRQEVDAVVAERQVAMWQQQMDDLVIRSPFDGVVTTKDSQPGEMISPVSAGGGFTRTGIGTVVDMSSLEIQIDVNESYINRVQPGQPVEATLDAYPDWKIPGKVIAIIPTADRDKSTVKVRVGFDKLDPRILPEMSIKVAFQEASGGAQAAIHEVVLPKDAVSSQDGRDVVYVVQNGRAERRAVTVSRTDNDDAVLSAGVSDGETVIVDAPPELKDGMAVKEKKL